MVVRDLIELLRVEYTLQNRASLISAWHHTIPVLRHLGDVLAEALTSSAVKEYQRGRLEEGAAPATVNNEVGMLSRSFHLAVEQDLLQKSPVFRRLATDNARQGFVKGPEFQWIARTLDVLDPAVAGVVRFLFLLGWRRREVLNLTWPEVDVEDGTVQLPARRSKTRKAKRIKLPLELLALLKTRWAARNGDFVFHRGGKPVKCFRGVWKRAVTAAGKPDLVPHDARRSFAKMGIDAGVDPKTLMVCGGWSTRSVFDRYSIVDETAIQAALTKVSDFAKRKPTESP